MIIVIEGSNYCGKSTVTDIVKKTYPGCTVFEFHDFYHQHILHQFDNIKSLYSKHHYNNLSIECITAADEYLLSRFDLLLKYLQKQTREVIIIERFFITQMVYRHLLFAIKDHSDLKKYENFAISNNALMMYITTSSNSITKRAVENNSKLMVRSRHDTPFHLRDISTLIRKNDLYNLYFDNYKGHKVRIDTSNLTINNLEAEIATILEKNKHL